MRPRLPPDKLAKITGRKATDFVTRAKKTGITDVSLMTFIFSLFWLGFTSIFVLVFFGPVFMGHEVDFRVNGVPTTASPDNLMPLFIPGIIIGVFLLFGLGTLAGSIYSVLSPGPWIIGMKDMLIIKKVMQKNIRWDQIDDVFISQKNSRQQDIHLKLSSFNSRVITSGPGRINVKSVNSFFGSNIVLRGIDNAQSIVSAMKTRIRQTKNRKKDGTSEITPDSQVS